MEKFLASEPIEEGDVYDQWVHFKREFEQFLLAVGKGDMSGVIAGSHIALCSTVSSVPACLAPTQASLYAKVAELNSCPAD